MKKTLLVLSLLGIFSLAIAHEFWLAPSQYRCAVGQQILLSLLVGEDFHGEVWEKRKERTLSLHLLGAASKQDLTTAVINGDSSAIPLLLEKEGTYLLALRSKNSYIELDGQKFNDYLEEDGIENITKLRTDKKELDKPARELYQRCAKTLLQVGSKTDETYKKILAQPLEIVPLKKPYALAKEEGLPVQILFNGKPLSDVVVRTWHKTPNTETQKGSLRTNAKGIVSTPALSSGEWMISLVRMVPNADKSKSDYQSYWASLTFER